jgi:hypothetical protein
VDRKFGQDQKGSRDGFRIGEGQERVAVVDGAEWIRRQLATRLPMVEVRILDYFHLMQHVGEAAAVCFGEGSEGAERWRRDLTAGWRPGPDGRRVRGRGGGPAGENL